MGDRGPVLLTSPVKQCSMRTNFDAFTGGPCPRTMPRTSRWYIIVAADRSQNLESCSPFIEQAHQETCGAAYSDHRLVYVKVSRSDQYLLKSPEALDTHKTRRVKYAEASSYAIHRSHYIYMGWHHANAISRTAISRTSGFCEM